MQPRLVARAGAALGVGFGAVGLFVPGSLATLFGIQLAATATALVRQVCASYVGFGALNWAARDLTDGATWRVVAVGNATGWAISGAVAATALASGLGDAAAWFVVALQFVMTIAWLGVLRRAAHQALTRAARGRQPANDLRDEVDMQRMTSRLTMTTGVAIAPDPDRDLDPRAGGGPLTPSAVARLIALGAVAGRAIAPTSVGVWLRPSTRMAGR